MQALATVPSPRNGPPARSRPVRPRCRLLSPLGGRLYKVEAGLQKSSIVDELHLHGQIYSLQILAGLEHLCRYFCSVAVPMFKSCKKLKSISLPSEVECVDDAAFLKSGLNLVYAETECKY